MLVKHLLKFASSMCMNGPTLQDARGDVFGNCDFSAAAASLFFSKLMIMNRERSSTHIMTYLRPLRSMNEPPTLWGECVFVDVGTVFQRAFV